MFAGEPFGVTLWNHDHDVGIPISPVQTPKTREIFCLPELSLVGARYDENSTLHQTVCSLLHLFGPTMRDRKGSYPRHYSFWSRVGLFDFSLRNSPRHAK